MHVAANGICMRYWRGISAPVASRGPTQKPEPQQRCRETRSLGGTRMEGRRRLSYRVDRSIEQLQASTSGCCGLVCLSVVDSQKGERKLRPELMASMPSRSMRLMSQRLRFNRGSTTCCMGCQCPHLSFLGLKSERTRTSATPICKDGLSRSHRR